MFLLYELLAGQTPFDAREMMQGGLDALRKIHPGERTAATEHAADPGARNRGDGRARHSVAAPLPAFSEDAARTE